MFDSQKNPTQYCLINSKYNRFLAVKHYECLQSSVPKLWRL